MKIAVLTSGGVDSSVALRLLKEEGADLTAFYIKIWLEDELAFLGDCPWEEDLAYVRAICDTLAIPLEVVSLQREYWEQVVAYTIDEVKAGRTPNPDIHCNARIKFGVFYQKIADDFARVATGHYARSFEKDGLTYLQTAKDSFKDQTYFLAHLRQDQIQRALFPIGGYTKPQIRDLAERFQLPNSRRKDSQGICFLGTIKYSDFLKYHLGEKPGQMIEFETGKILGKHRGFWFYTIGQRQGLGLSGGPWYVVKKNTAENLVFISRAYHADDKLRDTLFVRGFHWISAAPEGFAAPEASAAPATSQTSEGVVTSQASQASFECRVKIRHGEASYPACVEILHDGRGKIHLKGSDQGLAPGQYAVFYQDDICLGCAMIDEG